MPEETTILNKQWISVKTAIVGAGVAGISTALNLLKNNYESFLVFEALDRIGGRVNTIEYGDSFLEIGAQYLHGQVDNPFYYTARDTKQLDEKYDKIFFEDKKRNEDNNGICIERREAEDEEDSSYMFTTQLGEKINFEKAYDIYNVVNKLIREAKDYCLDEENKNKLVDMDQSVGDYIYNRLKEIIANGFKPKMGNLMSDSDLMKLIEGFLIWRCKCENIEIGCHSICDLSLRNYSIFVDLKGCQIMEPINGYQPIIDCMIKPYEEDFNSRVQLNSCLEKILLCKTLDANFNKNDPCDHCLYTNDKSKVVLLFTEKIVVCENVVCTMSLGYMKENLNRIIEPASLIPGEKLLAVERIGFGTVNKIFMHYDKPFWKENLEGIHNVWLKQDDAASLLDQTRGFTEANWFENIAYFETVNNHDHLLSAWIGGCEFFEKLSDEQISKDCTFVLRKMLNDETIPLPDSIIRSTWNSDKFFRGSYSFMPLGSDQVDLEHIAAPIQIDNKPVIMFAGEATNKTQFSTTHGAYNTGLREAKRILCHSTC